MFREAGVWECFRYRFSHTNGFCFFTFIGRGYLLLQPLSLLLLPLVEPEGLLHGQEEISPLLTTFLPQALLFVDEVIIKRLWDVLRDGSDTKLFLTLSQVCLLFGFLWILRERLPMSLCHCSQIISSCSSWCLDYIWGKIPQDHLWTEDKIGRRMFQYKISMRTSLSNVRFELPVMFAVLRVSPIMITDALLGYFGFKYPFSARGEQGVLQEPLLQAILVPKL